MNLTDIKTVRALCARHGIHAKKAFGQNFLTDGSVIDAIVDATAPCGCGVLEIGPGLGTLTRALSLEAEKVVAVELDTDLLPVLAETLADCQNTHVLQGDILKLDLPTIFRDFFSDLPISIAANLPYYITTPIILYLLEQKLPVERMVFMVQKEVADRMLAAPGKKDFGALTVAVQYRCRATRIVDVPSAAFSPAPKVDSTVVLLEFYDTLPVTPKNEAHFFSLVKAIFAQRRKTLLNGLANAGCFGTKEQIAEALQKMAFSPTVRGETLSISEMAALSDKLLENTR